MSLNWQLSPLLKSARFGLLTLLFCTAIAHAKPATPGLEFVYKLYKCETFEQVYEASQPLSLEDRTRKGLDRLNEMVTNGTFFDWVLKCHGPDCEDDGRILIVAESYGGRFIDPEARFNHPKLRYAADWVPYVLPPIDLMVLKAASGRLLDTIKAPPPYDKDLSRPLPFRFSDDLRNLLIRTESEPPTPEFLKEIEGELRRYYTDYSWMDRTVDSSAAYYMMNRRDDVFVRELMEKAILEDRHRASYILKVLTYEGRSIMDETTRSFFLKLLKREYTPEQSYHDSSLVIIIENECEDGNVLDSVITYSGGNMADDSVLERLAPDVMRRLRYPNHTPIDRYLDGLPEGARGHGQYMALESATDSLEDQITELRKRQKDLELVKRRLEARFETTDTLPIGAPAGE